MQLLMNNKNHGVSFKANGSKQRILLCGDSHKASIDQSGYWWSGEGGSLDITKDN